MVIVDRFIFVGEKVFLQTNRTFFVFAFLPEKLLALVDVDNRYTLCKTKKQSNYRSDYVLG